MRMNLGCVPYVNAKPLIAGLEEDSSVRLVLDVPSKLPALLDSGWADAVLASSFEALRTPGRAYVDDCSISSLGCAESVRLFSKEPLHNILTLALDQSSLTSNNLALGILAEHGVHPVARPMAPNLLTMLETCDAAVLIGDIGMVADGSGLKVYDLGEEWFRLTSLPFVWALWIGRTDLSSAVSSRLKAAKEVGAKSLEQIIAKAETESKWPEGRCETYLRQTMRYDLGDADLAGLRAYQELLVKHRLLEEAFFPARVSVDQSFLATM